MFSDENPTSRRAVMKGLGVGALAGALAPAGAALAQSPGAAGVTGEIWSKDYTAKKGDVSLYVFRKRVGAPRPGEPPKPVLFLVHGSSLSSLCFDITPPGRGEYSVMNVFARYGYDVWTMDHEGYGRSSQTSGNSDVASGVEDLKAALPIVQRESGQSRIHMFGESSGALRAAAFAVARPDAIDRLVLGALTYTGKGSPTLTKRAEQVEYYRTHNRRPRDREMIRSIFTRDKPGTSDPAVGDYMADLELKFGDTIPTGTYLDMTANLPVVDPTKLKAPVLVVRGEYDGIATEEDLWEFFRALPNPDRQYTILPGVAHSMIFGINREQFWYAMHAFLNVPPHINV